MEWQQEHGVKGILTTKTKNLSPRLRVVELEIQADGPFDGASGSDGMEGSSGGLRGSSGTL